MMELIVYFLVGIICGSILPTSIVLIKGDDSFDDKL